MTKNEYFKEISEKLKGMVGKTISSIGAHESLSLLEIVFSDKSLLRIEGWDYENQSNSEILISVANVNVDSGLKALDVPRLVVPSESLSIFDGVVKFRYGIIHICRHDPNTNTLHWEYPSFTKFGKSLFRILLNLCIQKNPRRFVR